MATSTTRARLEITINPAAKRVLMRWARRMNVSAGALLEYCFLEAQEGIREQLASLEDDIREESPDKTDGEMSDAAYERFGFEFVSSEGPV